MTMDWIVTTGATVEAAVDTALDELSKSFELQRIHSLGFGETKLKCEHVFVRWSRQLNESGEDPPSQTSVKRLRNKARTLKQDLPEKETKNALKLPEEIKTKKRVTVYFYIHITWFKMPYFHNK